MKLTRSQLKNLIESYLYEQEVEGAPPEDEEAPPEDEEVPAEDEEAPADDTTDTEDTDTDSGLPDKFKSYELTLGDNPKPYRIQFLKDKAVNKLKVSVDGSVISNPTKQDFVTLAAYGLIGVEDEDLQDQLSKVIKQDASFEKFETPKDVKEQVLNKIKGSRLGFTRQDVKKAIEKAVAL